MIDVSWCSSFLHEFIYRGTALVEIRENHKDPETKKPVSTIKTTYSDIPCLLSPETKEPSDNTALPTADKTIMLFLPIEYDIPPHSRITVTQDNRTDIYECSGIANTCQDGHQEIVLRKWETWA